MLTILSVTATAYGTAGALAILLQARQIWTRRASCDVSLRFLCIYTGGYAVWLGYGSATHSLALIVSDSVGLASGVITLTVALAFHQCAVAPLVSRKESQ